MERHVDAQAPLEACGLLAGRAGVVKVVLTVKNAAGSPVRFRMDAREQLRAFAQIEEAGLEMVGVFHSHPGGPPLPSPTDIREAAYQVANLIWAPTTDGWLARAFWIEKGYAAEIPIQLTDR